MRTGWGGDVIDCRFDVPPRFGTTERRMAARAIDAWTASGRTGAPGFADNSLTITDPAGYATVTAVASAVAATFGLSTGMNLARRPGFAAELAAACDLIALMPVPVPFEASFQAPDRSLVLARGVALPLFRHDAASGSIETGEVQVVVSWRQVLNRAATTRLRRELGAALRNPVPFSARIDPFSAKSAT